MKTPQSKLTIAASIAFAAAAALSREAQAVLSFNVEPNGWPNAAHRDAAIAAMQSATNRYNAYGDFGNYNVYVYYNAGIPTAQASYLGSIGFGGTYPNERVTLHEMSHYLGTGTYGTPWDGARGEALIDQFDGLEASLNGDGAHYWPYGLNFDSEGAEINRQRHVALLYAMRADMGIGSTANPGTATVVNLTASDAIGESGFNYASTWSDNRFAHPGAAYSTGNFLLRTPASGNSFSFVGDSVRVNNTNGINGGLLYKGTGTTGVTSFKNLILDGGYVRHANGSGDIFRLAGNVTLVTSSTIDAAQGAIVASANIGGSGSLTKTGSYPLVLSGGNTYSGSTTINAGILRLAPATAVADYTFDNVSGSAVINGGTGGATMNGTLANGAAIVGGGRFGNAVSLANGASVDISNPIADLGNNAGWTVSAWVKTTTPGASILTKGDGGWSSGNTIFYLGDGTAGGSGGIPSAVRWGGGFFQGSNSATAVNDGNWHQVTYVNSNGVYGIYVDGVPQPLSPGNSGFANADVGSVVRLGVSTNTFPADGTVNYNGLLDSVQFYGQALSAAQVAALFGGQSAGPLPFTTDVTIASGATLDVNGVMQQIGSLNGPTGSSVLLGAGRLTVSSAASTQFAGTISGSGSLAKGGAGTLTLAGSNTYTGGTTIAGGTLRVGSGAAMGSGAVTLNGGTLSSANNTGTEPTITNAIVAGVGGGNIAAGDGTIFRVNGNISGNGALGLSGVFNSAGLRLAGNNSAYTGTATVTGANTRLGSATAGSAAANWVINGNLQTDVAGGATFHLGALSGTGNISGHANNPSPAISTLSVGALNTNTIFAGTIIDNAADTATTGNRDGAQRNVLALTKVGTGTLTLAGVNTYTGPTTVSGGTLRLESNLTTTSAVNVTDATLEVASGGGSKRVVRATSIATTGTGRIDVRDNKLLTNTPIGTFTGGQYTGVQGELAEAYNFGNWDQPGLMTSMPDAGPLVGTTTIGVATAEQVLFIAPTETATVFGQSVTGATTLAMYTYAGDLNFDGFVDAADYGIIDNWVQFPDTSGWANGDLNYDGAIDAADYGIIDNTIQLQGAPLPGIHDTYATESFGALSDVAAVPEPTSLGTLGVAVAGLLGRRRQARVTRM